MRYDDVDLCLYVLEHFVVLQQCYEEESLSFSRHCNPWSRLLSFPFLLVCCCWEYSMIEKIHSLHNDSFQLLHPTLRKEAKQLCQSFVHVHIHLA